MRGYGVEKFNAFEHTPANKEIEKILSESSSSAEIKAGCEMGRSYGEQGVTLATVTLATEQRRPLQEGGSGEEPQVARSGEALEALGDLGSWVQVLV